MSTENDEGFLELWPTTLLQRFLPGHELANPALAAVIEQLESANSDLTTDYLSDNLLTHEHPAMQWLKDCINKTAVDYLQRQGLDYPVDWTLHGWANINRFGDYHDLHNHPHSYLSGTYYVALPSQKVEAGTRNDLSPGAISFYDPRPQANMTAIRGDAQISPQYTIQPQPGMILMWPSFLHHLVHPNLARQKRISISFNLMLKWSDDYLPAQ
ncbi:MAG TPA: TIGR02466 family protein [Gammaproteobacteria bacterium]|nr:TIGR02466 family protein [Gammaproteobacteria bacterium]